MKKWAESTSLVINPEDIEYLLKPHDMPEIIDDAQCNGEISCHMYHDGTFAHTDQLIHDALVELVVTHTKQIGSMTLYSDFIFCDMKYGDNRQAQRDTVKIKIKIEPVDPEDKIK